MTGKRLHYVDWLRVLAVLLLLPYHSARVFDVWSPFYAKNAATSGVLSYFIALVTFWHMPLLFFLAGASTWFALAKRTAGTFLGERALRLLLPFVFGMLVIVPPQFWYGAMQNSGYTGSFATFWPTVWRFNVSIPDYYGGFGFGHLWFIIFLFVFSVVLLPLFLYLRGKGSEGAARFARALAKPWWWWVPVFVILIFDSGPDLPNEGMIMLGAFVMGFVLMADGAFADAMERHRWVVFAIAAAFLAYTLAFYARGEAAGEGSALALSVDITRVFAAWFGAMTAVGFGKRYLDFRNGFLGYMAEASYPVYILHQTVIVVLGFYIVQLVWGVWPKFVLILAASTLVTFGLYDLVRRTAVTRFLFGMRPVPKPEPAPSEMPVEA